MTADLALEHPLTIKPTLTPPKEHVHRPRRDPRSKAKKLSSQKPSAKKHSTSSDDSTESPDIRPYSSSNSETFTKRNETNLLWQAQSNNLDSTAADRPKMMKNRPYRKRPKVSSLQK